MSLGLRVSGFWRQVPGCGIRDLGTRFRDSGYRRRVPPPRYQASGSRHRVQGTRTSGIRVSGTCPHARCASAATTFGYQASSIRVSGIRPRASGFQVPSGIRPQAPGFGYKVPELRVSRFRVPAPASAAATTPTNRAPNAPATDFSCIPCFEG
jgi:hypothetical protein